MKKIDFLTSLKISASGLAANRARMAAISSNVANSETTRTPEGGPYKIKDVIFSSGPTTESFGEILEGELDEQAQSVYATQMISGHRPPLFKYDPEHIDADEKGYVAYPGINVMEEMANMISASRAYEANISVFNTTKNMAMKALEIGRP